MKSRNLSSFAAFCTLALACVSAANAQSLGWGQHVTGYTGGYGAGYVGSVPYVPATAFYRAPAVPVAPTTSYYAPGPAGVVIAGQTPPNVYSSFSQYSPIVFPATTNANVANYPPNTVFPSVGYSAPTVYAARPVSTYSAGGTCVNCAPGMMGQPVVANYATPNFYRTNYARTPLTLYRPVTVMDPVTGGTNYVLQPCQGYEWQARRYETYKLFPGLHQRSAATACGTAQCSAPAAVAPQPYYVPSATTLPGPVSGVPANTIPSLTAPPPAMITTPGTSTIAPPATFTPAPTSSNVFPSSPTNIPSNSIPSLSPNPLNNSGPIINRNYAPATAVPATPVTPVTPDCPVPAPESAAVPASPEPAAQQPRLMLRQPLAPIAPPADEVKPDQKETPRDPKEVKEPADESPSLVPPANNNGSAEKPQATIRRQTNIVPIPDPEAPVTKSQSSIKAPPLLAPPSKDRTARLDVGTRPASYEQPIATPAVRTPINPPIIGDDAWQAVKK